MPSPTASLQQPKPQKNDHNQQKQNPESTPLPQSHNHPLPQSHNHPLPQSHNHPNDTCHCTPHQNIPFIGTRTQAPLWMQYPDLVTGYRINFSTFKLILKSLFALHNQTINVWTHLLGVILLIVTAVFTCSDYLYTFQKQFHVPLARFQPPHPMGSGKSFCQNMTQTCFNESSLSHNIQAKFNLNDKDQLSYDMCENNPNKHDCYLNKSHQRKFKNWLEFSSGISMDRLEEMKLMMEKQIVPDFVHNVEDSVSNTTNQVMAYIKHYLGLSKKNQAQRLTVKDISEQNEQNQSQPQATSSNLNNLAKWPLVFYLLCNSITLACSVIFHWFYPLSQKAHQFCRCTDFAGISFLFGFSPIPSIYYGMYCYFEVAEVYLTAMIACCLVVFFVSFTDRFQDRKNPTLRVGIYLCLTILTVTPLTHMTINEVLFNNYNEAFSLSNSMPWYILGLICYGIGGTFYVTQQLIPNRFSSTGKYDYWGHSHQFWHVMVVVGIMAIYVGCLENFFTRSEVGCAVIEY